MTETSRMVTEELLGAELVAGKELVEATGTLWDTLEKGAAIHRRQLEWFIADYARCASDMLSFDPARVPAAAIRLVRSRYEHLSGGFEESRRLIETECAPLAKLWKDYFAVVRRDWQPPAG